MTNVLRLAKFSIASLASIMARDLNSVRLLLLLRLRHHRAKGRRRVWAWTTTDNEAVVSCQPCKLLGVHKTELGVVQGYCLLGLQMYWVHSL